MPPYYGRPLHNARKKIELHPGLLAAAIALAGIISGAFLLRTHTKPTLHELVGRRVTSNGEDAPIQTIALSPDGKYLVYSDNNGAHLRSMETTDSRLLPETKGMSVEGWATDDTQFFLSKPAGEQLDFYEMSLPAEAPQRLGDARPSPEGKYAIRQSNSQIEITRRSDGKAFTIDRKDASIVGTAWSPHDRRLAVVFGRPTDTGAPVRSWIESLNGETGRWTTLVSPQPQYIAGAAWLSDRKVLYAKYEPTPRTDSNLWMVEVDPQSGAPLGPEKRRTQWADFEIRSLSAGVDGARLCFFEGSIVRTCT